MPRYRSYGSSRSYRQLTATIIWDNIIGAYRVNFSYNKDIVDLLKATIPASDRDYRPKENHTWVIHEKYYEPIRELLEAKFGKHNVKVTEKEEVKKQWENYGNYALVVTAVDYQTELIKFAKLLSDAGLIFDKTSTDGKVALKFYRRAALFYHPDRNPANAALMSELNSTFQKLKPYFGLENKNVN